jgi:F-type H+-transporting ATPase subunit gamma
MANLRDVRLRIRAVEQILQVTKAMNLISTAKLRKGRRMLQDTEPYFTRIQKSMFDLLSGAGNIKSAYFQNAESQAASSRSAILVVTSDRGLAGGYNANVFKYVNELCERVEKPLLIVVGSKGYNHFSGSQYIILENFSFHSQIPTVEHAGEIADYLLSQYIWGMFSDIHIAYTHMYSAIKMLPTERQIMPLNKEKIQQELSEMGDHNRQALKLEYLPSAGKVFDALVPQYIKGVIYGALVEAYASEQSSRMAAMDEASKNAEEMLAHLQISYNRARQAGITQEMSEIIGGATALAEK